MSPTEEGKLSKEEVDALLDATRQDEAAPSRPEPIHRVQGYDFLQPRRFNRTQLEKLKKINEPLAQHASNHASRLLRSNVRTQLVTIDQMKWEHLLEEMGESAVGFVFVLEPLGWRGVLALEGQFAAAALERMMGGQAAAGEAATIEFSDIDVHVLTGFVEGFLKPLPQLWERIGAFTVQQGQFVSDLQSVDFFRPEEDFVLASFLMQCGTASGQVGLLMPFEAVRALPPESDEQAQAPMGHEEIAAGLRESLRQSQVQLTAVLGTADIKVSRLLGAEPGDVIVLDTRIGEAVLVKVNDKVKFKGLPGMSNGKAAVQLVAEE